MPVLPVALAGRLVLRSPNLPISEMGTWLLLCGLEESHSLNAVFVPTHPPQLSVAVARAQLPKLRVLSPPTLTLNGLHWQPSPHPPQTPHCLTVSLPAIYLTSLDVRFTDYVTAHLELSGKKHCSVTSRGPSHCHGGRGHQVSTSQYWEGESPLWELGKGFLPMKIILPPKTSPTKGKIARKRDA